MEKGILKYNLFFLFLFSSPWVIGQNIREIENPAIADLKIFIVKDNPSLADLNVFITKYPSQARKNDGKWFLTFYPSNTDFTVYYTNFITESDLKVYFVETQIQAKWINKAKTKLLRINDSEKIKK